ncbi:hypothetical protein [Paraburkholderia tropica]|uniref:hypothetical protein n=1 Tax=Paraburkholderia tropica TaxID=92647 RepID=UPI001CC4DCE1|nr:hypothetical protein [Paraburkholderia tropica]
MRRKLAYRRTGANAGRSSEAPLGARRAAASKTASLQKSRNRRIVGPRASAIPHPDASRRANDPERSAVADLTGVRIHEPRKTEQSGNGERRRDEKGGKHDTS